MLPSFLLSFPSTLSASVRPFNSVLVADRADDPVVSLFVNESRLEPACVRLDFGFKVLFAFTVEHFSTGKPVALLATGVSILVGI